MKINWKKKRKLIEYSTINERTVRSLIIDLLQNQKMC